MNSFSRGLICLPRGLQKENPPTNKLPHGKRISFFSTRLKKAGKEKMGDQIPGKNKP